jgi:phospholipid/cholesterol/gamma-HCH transport system substrate-binding protein
VKDQSKYALKVGTFIAGGLLLLILAIYIVGKNYNIFQSTVSLEATFSDVQGLQEGNNVRFAGINVGTINKISILNDSTVLVEMSVQKKASQYIKKDSHVEIDSEGIMGNKILVILPGSAKSGVVADEERLESRKTIGIEDVLKQIEQTSLTTKAVANNLEDITNKINMGKGDLGMLVNDTTFKPQLDEMAREMTNITDRTQSILRKIEYGNGDIARLINDSALYTQSQMLLERFDSTSRIIHQTSQEVLSFSKALNNKEGIVSRLVYDSTLSYTIDSTITNLNNGIDQLESTAKVIEESWILGLFSGKND